MSTKLVPNERGLIDIRIDATDARNGYVMIEDWDGKEHQIMLRGNEGDVITLPVPKIRRNHQPTHEIPQNGK